MKTKKTLFILTLLVVFLLTGTSCTILHPQHHSKGEVHTNAKGDIPPGQKKKNDRRKECKTICAGPGEKALKLMI